MNCFSPRDDAQQRTELAGELVEALDEVVFNLEHGVPWAVLHRLQLLGEALSESVGDDPALAGEVERFRACVGEFFVDQGAPDEILVHGRNLVERMR